MYKNGTFRRNHLLVFFMLGAGIDFVSSNGAIFYSQVLRGTARDGFP
jgi:hypothetical protein